MALNAPVEEKEDEGFVLNAFLRGIDESQMMFYSFVDVIGELTGVDLIEKFGEDGVRRNIEQIMANPARVETWDDAEGLSKKAQYVIERMVEETPAMFATLGAALFTGGAAAGGAAASRLALTAGGKKALLKSMADPATGKALARIIGREAIQGFDKKAAARAAALVNIQEGIGETQLGLVEDDVEAPFTAVGFGIAKGLLDQLGEAKIVRIAMGTGDTPEGVIRKAAHLTRQVIGAGVVEGTTEAMQTVVDHMARSMHTGEDLLTEERIKEIKESAIAGAAVGSGFGALFGGTRMAIDYAKVKANLDKETIEDVTEFEDIVEEEVEPSVSPTDIPDDLTEPEAPAEPTTPAELDPSLPKEPTYTEGEFSPQPGEMPQQTPTDYTSSVPAQELPLPKEPTYTEGEFSPQLGEMPQQTPTDYTSNVPPAPEALVTEPLTQEAPVTEPLTQEAPLPIGATPIEGPLSPQLGGMPQQTPTDYTANVPPVQPPADLTDITSRVPELAEPGAAAPTPPPQPATSLFAGPPSSPEPAGDIDAQFRALVSPDTEKDFMFIAEGSPDVSPDLLAELFDAVDEDSENPDPTARPAVANKKPNRLVVPTDQGLGVIYTTNPRKLAKVAIDTAKAGSVLTNEQLGDLLYDRPLSKLDSDGTSVVGRDADGNVVSQINSRADTLQNDLDTTARTTPPDGSVSVEGIQDSLAERQAKVEREAFQKEMEGLAEQLLATQQRYDVAADLEFNRAQQAQAARILDSTRRALENPKLRRGQREKVSAEQTEVQNLLRGLLAKETQLADAYDKISTDPGAKRLLARYLADDAGASELAAANAAIQDVSIGGRNIAMNLVAEAQRRENARNAPQTEPEVAAPTGVPADPYHEKIYDINNALDPEAYRQAAEQESWLEQADLLGENNQGAIDTDASSDELMAEDAQALLDEFDTGAGPAESTASMQDKVTEYAGEAVKVNILKSLNRQIQNPERLREATKEAQKFGQGYDTKEQAHAVLKKHEPNIPDDMNYDADYEPEDPAQRFRVIPIKHSNGDIRWHIVGLSVSGPLSPLDKAGTGAYTKASQRNASTDGTDTRSSAALEKDQIITAINKGSRRAGLAGLLETRIKQGNKRINELAPEQLEQRDNESDGAFAARQKAEAKRVEDIREKWETEERPALVKRAERYKDSIFSGVRKKDGYIEVDLAKFFANPKSYMVDSPTSTQKVQLVTRNEHWALWSAMDKAYREGQKTYRVPPRSFSFGAKEILQLGRTAMAGTGVASSSTVGSFASDGFAAGLAILEQRGWNLDVQNGPYRTAGAIQRKAGTSGVTNKVIDPDLLIKHGDLRREPNEKLDKTYGEMFGNPAQVPTRETDKAYREQQEELNPEYQKKLAAWRAKDKDEKKRGPKPPSPFWTRRPLAKKEGLVQWRNRLWGKINKIDKEIANYPITTGVAMRQLADQRDAREAFVNNFRGLNKDDKGKARDPSPEQFKEAGFLTTEEIKTIVAEAKKFSEFKRKKTAEKKKLLDKLRSDDPLVDVSDTSVIGPLYVKYGIEPYKDTRSFDDAVESASEEMKSIFDALYYFGVDVKASPRSKMRLFPFGKEIDPDKRAAELDALVQAKEQLLAANEALRSSEEYKKTSERLAAIAESVRNINDTLDEARAAVVLAKDRVSNALAENERFRSLDAEGTLPRPKISSELQAARDTAQADLAAAREELKAAQSKAKKQTEVLGSKRTKLLDEREALFAKQDALAKQYGADTEALAPRLKEIEKRTRAVNEMLLTKEEDPTLKIGYDKTLATYESRLRDEQLSENPDGRYIRQLQLTIKKMKQYQAAKRRMAAQEYRLKTVGGETERKPDRTIRTNEESFGTYEWYWVQDALDNLSGKPLTRDQAGMPIDTSETPISDERYLGKEQTVIENAEEEETEDGKKVIKEAEYPKGVGKTLIDGRSLGIVPDSLAVTLHNVAMSVQHGGEIRIFADGRATKALEAAIAADKTGRSQAAMKQLRNDPSAKAAAFVSGDVIYVVVRPAPTRGDEETNSQFTMRLAANDAATEVAAAAGTLRAALNLALQNKGTAYDEARKAEYDSWVKEQKAKLAELEASTANLATGAAQVKRAKAAFEKQRRSRREAMNRAVKNKDDKAAEVLARLKAAWIIDRNKRPLWNDDATGMTNWLIDNLYNEAVASVIGTRSQNKRGGLLNRTVQKQLDALGWNTDRSALTENAILNLLDTARSINSAFTPQVEIVPDTINEQRARPQVRPSRRSDGRQPTPTRGHHAILRQRIKKALPPWAEARSNIVFVSTVANAKQKLRDFYGMDIDVAGTTTALYLPAVSAKGKPTILFITENIADHKEAQRFFAHEMLGHHGVAAYMNSAEKDEFMRLIKASDNKLGLGKYFESVRKAYPDMSYEDQLEEVLGRAAEEMPSNLDNENYWTKTKAATRKAWLKIKDFIHKMLQKYGYIDKDSLSERDLQAALNVLGRRIRATKYPTFGSDSYNLTKNAIDRPPFLQEFYDTVTGPFSGLLAEYKAYTDFVKRKWDADPNNPAFHTPVMVAARRDRYLPPRGDWMERSVFPSARAEFDRRAAEQRRKAAYDPSYRVPLTRQHASFMAAAKTYATEAKDYAERVFFFSAPMDKYNNISNETQRFFYATLEGLDAWIRPRQVVMGSSLLNGWDGVNDALSKLLYHNAQTRLDPKKKPWNTSVMEKRMEMQARLYALTKTWSETEKAAVFKEMAEETPYTNKSVKAKELTDLISEFGDYLVTNMQGFEKLDNYFHRSYNVTNMAADQERVLEMFMRHGMKEEAAVDALDAIIRTDFSDTLALDFLVVQQATFAKNRTINNPALIKEMVDEGYLNSDPIHHTMVYFEQAIRRAETERIFGSYRHPLLDQYGISASGTDAMQLLKRRIAARDDLTESDLAQARIDVAAGVPIANSHLRDYTIAEMFSTMPLAEQKRIVTAALPHAIANDPDALKAELSRRYDPSGRVGYIDIANQKPGAIHLAHRTRITAKMFHGAVLKTPYDPLDPVQKALNEVRAYESLRTLMFSGVASIAEVAGIKARAKSSTGLLDFSKIVGDLVINRGDYRENMYELARAMGVIREDVGAAAATELTSMETSGFFSKHLTALFKYNGNDAVTNFSRVAALAVGRDFLVSNAATLHKAQQTYGQLRFTAEGKLIREPNMTAHEFVRLTNAARYLAELGIQDHQDVINWVADGRPMWNGTISAGAHAGNDNAKRMQDAMIMFINESVINPNAMERPSYADSLLGRMLYHLKQFSDSFFQVVVMGMFNEQVSNLSIEGKDAKLAAAVTMLPTLLGASMVFLAFGALSEELRQRIRSLGEKGGWDRANGDPTKYLQTVMLDRAGFNTVPLFDAVFGPDRPSSFTYGLGPTVYHATETAGMLFDDDPNFMRAILHSTPGISQLPSVRREIYGYFEEPNVQGQGY